jgi:hypothetical protein
MGGDDGLGSGGLGVVGEVEDDVSLGGLVVEGVDGADAGWVEWGYGLAVGVAASYHD